MTDQHAPPVFVGGAQRSGTHALAALVGAHSRYRAIRRELLFHVVLDGLPGVLDGTVAVGDFAERLRTVWWRREVVWAPGVTRGLHKGLARPELDAALDAFLARAEDDPAAAGGELVGRIARATSGAAPPVGWVEMTPTNAAAGGALSRLAPDMRLVHVLRDGRDVACSLARLPWGPRTVEQGLEHWGKLVRRSDAGAQEAPADRVHTVALEDLVLRRREETLTALLGFLELEAEDGVRRLFAEQITPERAHLGRWRHELEPGRRERVTARYHELLGELAAAGVAALPEPDPLPAGVGGYAWRPALSPIDPWADGRGVDA